VEKKESILESRDVLSTMSASLDQTRIKVKNECFTEGIKVSVLVGGHIGRIGVITQCSNQVQVELENGIHVQGPYTMFRPISNSSS